MTSQFNDGAQPLPGRHRITQKPLKEFLATLSEKLFSRPMSENDSTTSHSTPPVDPQVSPPQLENPSPAVPASPTGGSYFDNLDGKKWAMFLHLSQLTGLVVPGVGFAAPIIIWQIQKEKFPELDAHGKMVTNWLISVLIYSVAASLLGIVTCGFGMFLLIPIGVLTVVFPILGGIKASEGGFWNYPLTIKLIK